jgi:hypothetical protein
MISMCWCCCHVFDVISSVPADAVMSEFGDDAFFVVSVAGNIVVVKWF